MKLTTNNPWLQWTLLGMLVLFPECGAGESVILLRSVHISTDAVRLSDLLPPDVPSEMQQAGERIELGRTPQCHTMRILDPAAIKQRTSVVPVLQGLTLSGPVSVWRACFLLRREAVLRVISEFVSDKRSAAGMAGPLLTWSEAIYASQENPALEIVQVHPDPTRSALQIRVRCVERDVCPSFWVGVPARLRPHFVSTATTGHATEKSTVLVKSGQHVVLIFDDSTLRIRLQAICLQRGSMGEQIRVMDPASHRVFLAEVTGAGTLRAHL